MATGHQALPLGPLLLVMARPLVVGTGAGLPRDMAPHLESQPPLGVRILVAPLLGVQVSPLGVATLVGPLGEVTEDPLGVVTEDPLREDTEELPGERTPRHPPLAPLECLLEWIRNSTLGFK